LKSNKRFRWFRKLIRQAGYSWTQSITEPVLAQPEEPVRLQLQQEQQRRQQGLLERLLHSHRMQKSHMLIRMPSRKMIRTQNHKMIHMQEQLRSKSELLHSSELACADSI
jgi:hypothetical protein